MTVIGEPVQEVRTSAVIPPGIRRRIVPVTVEEAAVEPIIRIPAEQNPTQLPLTAGYYFIICNFAKIIEIRRILFIACCLPSLADNLQSALLPFMGDKSPMPPYGLMREGRAQLFHQAADDAAAQRP